jgi:hypothetical protein
MKKTILLLIGIVVILSQTAHSQNQKNGHFYSKTPLSTQKFMANDYQFSALTGTYANLTNAISVNNGQLWDDPVFTIPIGFNFPLYNMTLNQIVLGAGLGFMVCDTVDTINNYAFNYAILAFEADLIDRSTSPGQSLSPISYKVDGTAGSRIFKLEFNNAGFYSDATHNDFVNVQLWFYEGSGAIEIHYGPNQITDASIDYDGETGAYIGLADYNINNLYLLGGPVASPSLLTGSSVSTVDGTPSNGTIYRFERTTTGIHPINASSQVELFPNPCHDKAFIKLSAPLEQGAIAVFNVEGQIIQQYDASNKNIIPLDMSALSPGIYFYALTQKGATISHGKFMVN